MSDDEETLHEWKIKEKMKLTMDKLGVKDYNEADASMFDIESRGVIQESGFSGAGTRMEDDEESPNYNPPEEKDEPGEASVVSKEYEPNKEKMEEKLGQQLQEKEYEALKGMDKYVKGDGFDNSACINDLEGKEGIDDPAAVCRSAEIAHTGEAHATNKNKQERQVRGDVEPDKSRAKSHNKRTRSGKTMQESLLSEDAEVILENLNKASSGVLVIGRNERAQKALEELQKEGHVYFDRFRDDPNKYAVVDSEDDGNKMKNFFHTLQEEHYYDNEPKGTDKRNQAGNSKDERLPEGWEEIESTYGKLSEDNDEVTSKMMEDALGREMDADEYKTFVQLKERRFRTDNNRDRLRARQHNRRTRDGKQIREQIEEVKEIISEEDTNLERRAKKVVDKLTDKDDEEEEDPEHHPDQGAMSDEKYVQEMNRKIRNIIQEALEDTGIETSIDNVIRRLLEADSKVSGLLKEYCVKGSCKQEDGSYELRGHKKGCYTSKEDYEHSADYGKKQEDIKRKLKEALSNL